MSRRGFFACLLPAAPGPLCERESVYRSALIRIKALAEFEAGLFASSMRPVRPREPQEGTVWREFWNIATRALGR